MSLIQEPLGHRNWPEWLVASEGARLEKAGADETYRVGWTKPLPPFVVLVFSFLSEISFEDHSTSKFGSRLQD